MKRKKNLIAAGIVVICIISFLILTNIPSGKLEFNLAKEGMVTDEVTAIKIAEAVGKPIFGKHLRDYKPFHATLQNDSIWYVYGLPRKMLLSVQLGGSPCFNIQKKDGKVLNVYLSR